MDTAVRSARARLAALGLSQTARVLADNCLRVFVVLEVARQSATHAQTAWHVVTAGLAIPAVVLSPLHGSISNSLPKNRVLVGAAAYCLGVVALFAAHGGPWPVAWVLLAVGTLVYSPTRYALLPAAATDTQIPLPRVVGWVEGGAFIGTVAGLLLGVHLSESSSPSALPPAVLATLLIGLFCLVTAWPAYFPSDVYRPETARQALAGFFLDIRRIFADQKPRTSLFGLASLRGLVVAMTGGIVACVLSRGGSDGAAASLQDLIRAGLWILVGVAAGSLLASLQGHPYRSLALVPLGATGLTAGLVWAAVVAGVDVPSWLCFALGVFSGTVNVPLAAAYQASVPPDARGNAMAVRNLLEYFFMAAGAGLLFVLVRSTGLTPAGQLWVAAGLAAVAAAAAWRVLLRAVLEQILAIVMRPFYRLRAHGPGIDRVPLRGPVLVIANHTSYFDPVFVGKVIPRRLVPMMTSVFYDRPLLRWLMVHVVGAIRVEASAFRREVPELDEAVRTLNRGDCLVIFPEGMLRRKEEVPLRQFGQGVWRVLCERPQTPVVVLWIEGGWGSYLSYRGGPPGKYKQMDWRRPIDVAVEEPVVLDEKTLADQRATRAFLMERCRNARRHLGLSPV